METLTANYSVTAPGSPRIITAGMISSICSKYALPSANVSSLRSAALFITAYYAFLRFAALLL